MSKNPDELRLQQDLLPRAQLNPYLRGGGSGSTPVAERILQAFANLVGAQLTGAGPDELGTPVLLGADSNRALYVRLQPSTGVPTTGQQSLSGTAAQIVAASTSRNGVVISNTNTTTGCYIGAAGVNAATGLYLPPNQAISLSSTAAIFGYDSTVTVTVTYLSLPA